MTIPQSLSDHIAKVKAQLSDAYWGETYDKCFRSSWETTAVFRGNTTFMITGDIPAMWLRDSTMQVFPYLAHMEDEAVRAMVRGVLRTQMRLIAIDPYANAFNQNGDYASWDPNDHTKMTAHIWERKYEVDSLAMPLHLLLRYFQNTGDIGAFCYETKRAIDTILSVWETEQRHFEGSPYSFERDSDLITETLQNGGKGTPTGYTGMTWSGFRPSDDACTYHYLVPSNMLACAALEQLAALQRPELDNARMAKLAKEIREGIAKYAVTDKGIYAYETDGLGNYNCMDDANLPSLLAAPYYGFCKKNDETYLATRAFVLSDANPYFYRGKACAGVGSPHTPNGYVWHIALAAQGLTTDDVAEKKRLLQVMLTTDAGCQQMHESFHPDDPAQFTRPWFAWANAMFCLLTDDYLASIQ